MLHRKLIVPVAGFWLPLATRTTSQNVAQLLVIALFLVPEGETGRDVNQEPETGNACYRGVALFHVKH